MKNIVFLQEEKCKRSLGSLIRDKRLAWGLTQEDVARYAKIPLKQLKQYEKGAGDISCGELYDICHILKIRISSLFKNFSS
jgi:transcriptional regulator with XRE-family HTH domain